MLATNVHHLLCLSHSSYHTALHNSLSCKNLQMGGLAYFGAIWTLYRSTYLSMQNFKCYQISREKKAIQLASLVHQQTPKSHSLWAIPKWDRGSAWLILYPKWSLGSSWLSVTTQLQKSSLISTKRVIGLVWPYFSTWFARLWTFFFLIELLERTIY